MIEFTFADYWRYRAKFPSDMILSDQKEEYERPKTHQYHDKVFKEILNNKKEFINFIKRYTEYNTVKLEEDKLERYNPKFITSNFEIKEMDII